MNGQRPQDDEETPLVQRLENPMTRTRTPLPWDQFWVVLFLQVSDPLALQTIAPFTPQLIRDIGVTHGDESLVGHYVGILQSSYFAAQALTVLYWSQLSDHIGRKPVLLIALFGISIAMFSFGFSKTFFSLLVSRVICGSFNGGNGLIKSLVMDITDTSNLPSAYGYMPLPFMIGHVIGPLVGGTFSRPADRFPGIFGQSELLKTYPYLLPCVVPATFAAVAWIVTYLHLKESVSTKAPLGELIKERFLRWSSTKPSIPLGLGDALASSDEADLGEIAPRPLPLRAVLTPKVLSVTASYGAMALVHVAFMSMLPVFYATSIELGGLSLDPPRIGTILGALGLAQGIFQLLFYARLNDRFGAGTLSTAGVFSGIPIVILFPVINALARAHGMSWAVWLAIYVQLSLMINLAMCYACFVLYIKAASPNRDSLGATNGIVQLVVTGARVIGPASAASVFSYSMREGHDTWSVYYFLMTLVFIAIGTSMLLPRDPSLWQDDE